MNFSRSALFHRKTKVCLKYFVTDWVCEKAAAQRKNNIPTEVLKRCNFNDIILKFANRLLKEYEKTNQWPELDMMPKAGDLSDAGNYRGPSLSLFFLNLSKRWYSLDCKWKWMVILDETKMALIRVKPTHYIFLPSEDSLTHFSSVSHFYTPWKRLKTIGFLTFSRGIEMWHWTKMG